MTAEPIVATCPECGKKYRLKKPKAFQCKSCDAKVPAPVIEEAQEAPDHNPEAPSSSPAKEKIRPKRSRKGTRRTTSKARRKSSKGDDAKDSPKPKSDKPPKTRRHTKSTSRREGGRQPRNPEAEGKTTGRSSRRDRTPSKSSPLIPVLIGAVLLIGAGLAFVFIPKGGNVQDTSQSSQPKKSRPEKEGWGEAVSGLRARLLPSVDQLSFSDEVDYSWEIFNETDQPISISGMTLELLSEVRSSQIRTSDPNSEPIPNWPTNRPPQDTTIPPQTKFSFSFLKISAMQFNIPIGKYQEVVVQIRAVFQCSQGSWTGRLETPPLKVRFSRPEEARLDAFIKQGIVDNRSKSKKLLNLEVFDRLASDTKAKALLIDRMKNAKKSIRLKAAEIATRRGFEEALPILRTWAEKAKLTEEEVDKVNGMIKEFE
ncbi:MAG: hypothetical protein QF752_10335 [Planctomycetota bacterium]|nr:hypothetical protein [Planctomycetota bacterium]